MMWRRVGQATRGRLRAMGDADWLNDVTASMLDAQRNGQMPTSAEVTKADPESEENVGQDR